MRYVIGDIHGNVRELERLLEVLHLQKEDELIFVGDYIDKLPHTLETIALLTSLKQEHACVFLRGNHEFVWDRYVNEKEIERQSFLLEYGGKEALSTFAPEVQNALEKNELEVLHEALLPYFGLIADMKDYVLVDEFLVLHAGLLEEQYNEEPIVFEEKNYFLRPESILAEKNYINRYTLVAGHTHLSEEPTIQSGYINIDLGAGYGKYLGALCIEDRKVIRSDGAIFPL